MVPFGPARHTPSGPLYARDAGVTLEDAQVQVLAYVEKHCKADSRPPLAGNTVATDRAFIDRYMPELASFLNCRIAALPSIKEPSRPASPCAFYHPPPTSRRHRPPPHTRAGPECLPSSPDT